MFGYSSLPPPPCNAHLVESQGYCRQGAALHGLNELKAAEASYRMGIQVEPGYLPHPASRLTPAGADHSKVRRTRSAAGRAE